MDFFFRILCHELQFMELYKSFKHAVKIVDKKELVQVHLSVNYIPKAL